MARKGKLHKQYKKPYFFSQKHSEPFDYGFNTNSKMQDEAAKLQKQKHKRKNR